MKYNISGIKNITPIGTPCKKTTYHTQAEAEDMIRHLTETRITKKIRPYQCTICGFWHL